MAQHVQFKSDSNLVLSHWYRYIKLNPLITTSFEVYRWLKTKLYVKTAPWWELWHKWDCLEVGESIQASPDWHPDERLWGGVRHCTVPQADSPPQRTSHSPLGLLPVTHIHTGVTVLPQEPSHGPLELQPVTPTHRCYWAVQSITVLWSCYLWHQNTGVLGCMQSCEGVMCDSTKYMCCWAVHIILGLLPVTSVNPVLLGCTVLSGCYRWHKYTQVLPSCTKNLRQSSGFACWC